MTVKRYRVLPLIGVMCAGVVLALTPQASAVSGAPDSEAVPSAPNGVTRSATTPAPYVPVRAAGQPIPVAPVAEPANLEDFAEYQGQRECTPAGKIGALRLTALLRATYGSADVGIDRDCSDGGQSEHKEGRAIDWMLSYKVPAQKAKVEAFLWWLLKADPAGRPAANARRLGIMYLGWHDRFWGSYRADQGWTELKGCFGTPSADYDTYCHRDHLHISLSWDGGSARTSFWDGTADSLSACTEPDGSAVALGKPLATAVTAVTSFPLIRTRTGFGITDGPCRLQADRWDGDGRGLEVPVLGMHGVPATGVAAVRVHVGVSGVNAPTSLVGSGSSSVVRRTWPLDGLTMGNGVNVGINLAKVTDLILPVSKSGTVVLTNLYGAVDLVVNVTGYVPVVAVTPAPPAGTLPAFPGTIMKIGSHSSAVAAVQKALIRRGYAIATIAARTTPLGRFDKATAAAVKKYELRRLYLKLTDGTVNPRVYSSITGWVAPTTPPVLPSVSLASVVAKDAAAVTIVQGGLNTVTSAGLIVDGGWGPLTQAAFDAFRVNVLHLTGAAATGVPTLSSLTELGTRAGFTVTA